MTPLNGSAAKTTRFIEVTEGNLRQSHIYVRAHYDFFPNDCFGLGCQRTERSGTIEIQLDGMDATIATDIACDAKTGKPRGFFRERAWIRRFFRHHGVQAGARLALERLSERHYRLSVAASSDAKSLPLTCAEFFAGVGLVRLALERQGWQIVFANDIHAKKAEMYFQNWPDQSDLKVADIHRIGADEILDCTLYTASFPCNDSRIALTSDAHKGELYSVFASLPMHALVCHG